MSTSAFAGDGNASAASFADLPTSSPGMLARLAAVFIRWQLRRLQHKIELIEPRACFLR